MHYELMGLALALDFTLLQIQADSHKSAIALGHPKALGNSWAKQVATENGHAQHLEEEAGDAFVWDLPWGLLESWWDRRHRTMAWSRCLLEQLYLCSVVVEPSASASTLRHPAFQGNGDVHLASSEMIKWLAWLQKGCLAIRMWLVGNGLADGPTVCLCSG
jgi:hypothetical protein